MTVYALAAETIKPDASTAREMATMGLLAAGVAKNLRDNPGGIEPGQKGEERMPKEESQREKRIGNCTGDCTSLGYAP
jgi:hypothetical protein